MFEQSILAATDFSDGARPALRTAAHLAKRRDVPLTVLYALEWAADDSSWYPTPPEEENASREESVEALEAEFESVVSGPEQPEQVEFEVRLEYPEVAIVEAVERGEHGLVVLGATGLNRVANFVLGSVPEGVVRRSPRPVLVVPSDAETDGSYEQIVAPVDFSPCSRRSLAHAAGLARENDAALTVIHATPVMAAIESAPGAAAPGHVGTEDMLEHRASQFDEFLAEAPLDGIDWERRQEVGTPREVITGSVEEVGGDLIVMGTHGRRGFERFLLGSTATKILRSMPCSVVTVREVDEPAGGDT